MLRWYRGDELPALVEAVNDSLEHLRPWMPWASTDPLLPALSEFVERSVTQADRGEEFRYAMWDDQTSVLVGSCGLHRRLGPGRLEIGYWVRTGWLRRGVATAAAQALTTCALALPGIEEIHIHCDEANVASSGVPRRLGYRLERIVDEPVAAPAEVGRSMEWVVGRDQWRQVYEGSE